MGSQDLPKRPRITPTYPERITKVGNRTCPRCGGTMILLPEGLLVCYNDKQVFQTTGYNYTILRAR